MFKETHIIHETCEIRTEVFEDKNELWRARIVDVLEDAESIIFTSIKGYERVTDAEALLNRVEEEFSTELSAKLSAACAENAKLKKAFDELQKKYNRLDHSVEQRDELLKTKVEIAENQVHYAQKSATHWRMWSVASWCCTAAVSFYSSWFVW